MRQQIDRAELAKRPSMHDVARRVGVSAKTVSRVLNEPSTVSPETRDAVNEAITALGYRRNDAARALKTNSSHLIGILTTDSAQYGMVTTLAAVEAAGRRRGFSTLITMVPGAERADIRAAAERQLELGVAGIVTLLPHWGADEGIAEVATFAPVVNTGGETRSADFGLVAADQARGALLALEHVASLGARRIVEIAGPREWSGARRRHRAIVGGVTDLGLDLVASVQGDWSSGSGYRLGGAYRGRALPDAFVVGNDLMALGLLAALHEQGRRVPDDVFVTGFDDMPGSESFIPPLTTVRPPFAELGELAVDVLLEGSYAGHHALIAPELVVRRSAPRSR